MQKNLLLTLTGILILGLGIFLVLQGNPKNGGQISAAENPNASIRPTTSQTDKQTQPKINNLVKAISMDEVKKHDKRSDCWMAIDKKVYDITEFIPEHPGGSIIVQGCGSDATTMFEMQRKHQGDRTQSLLSKYYIGELKV